uniref:CCHC-type domain-containing protein n=1 Tax=Tanacetum cinerariifolium TaxID=118510 RepID=A0A6L2M8D5_TANCI|nr:hypothetical protein [Tanacetum cinerariifolium]
MVVAAQIINNLTLRYEKKLRFMKQPMAPAPDPETADLKIIDKYYVSVNIKQEEDGQSVRLYLLKMKRYLDTLERVGLAMPNELVMSLILNSLNKDYEQFIQNYIMHSMGKTLVELHAMLKLQEKGIPKKNKLAYAPKPKILPPPKRENLEKDSICHHCKEVGHWRRNCPSYHVKLKKRKNVRGASTLGIFTIGLYAFPNKSWVYDTSCRTHICNTSQGLRKSRKLKHGALSLKRHDEVEPTEVEPYSVEVPIRRSEWISQAADRYSFYVDAKEHELGDLNEPPNYKAALSYPEFDKGLDAMITEMQSMKDNQVWYVVDLPPNGRTVGSKWIFKKKNDMDGNQASRSLNKRFDEEIKKVGFTQNPNEPCVYLKVSREAEYIAIAKASMEAVWMRKFIDGLEDVMPLNKRPMEMLCDNAPAIAIANDPKIMKGARHYQRKYRYIREVIQAGKIVLKKVHTYDNLADSFTKLMPYNKHFEHAMGIGFCPATSLM